MTPGHKLLVHYQAPTWGRMLQLDCVWCPVAGGCNLGCHCPWCCFTWASAAAFISRQAQASGYPPALCFREGTLDSGLGGRGNTKALRQDGQDVNVDGNSAPRSSCTEPNNSESYHLQSPCYKPGAMLDILIRVRILWLWVAETQFQTA